jgi:multiple sugar transport system substrate-binding protein
MASYPHFPESKGAMEISTNIYVLAKTSKNQDAAFQVISYLTSSSEVQSSMAAKNLLPVVKVDNVDKIFGKEIPILNGKNVKAILNTKWLDDHLPSRYDPTAKTAYDKYVTQYIQGQMDERTALAKAEEEANSEIADLKGK